MGLFGPPRRQGGGLFPSMPLRLAGAPLRYDKPELWAGPVRRGDHPTLDDVEDGPRGLPYHQADCHEIYGDFLWITTSGLMACGCTTAGSGSKAVGFAGGTPPNGDPNGVFFLQWSDADGGWSAQVGAGFIYTFASSDCSGFPSVTQGVVLGIGLVCRLDLGYGFFDVVGQARGTGAIGDIIDNEGVCWENYVVPGGTIAQRLISGGIITITTEPP